jgi:hypothetical protein
MENSCLLAGEFMNRALMLGRGSVMFAACHRLEEVAQRFLALA